MKIKMEKKTKTTLASVLLSMLTLGVIAIGLLCYKNSLETKLSLASCSTLERIMEQQRFAFTSQLEDQRRNMKIYAGVFEGIDMNRDELLQRLNLVMENSTFDYFTYALTDGEALENTGVALNLADRDYFKHALNGETVISRPVNSLATGTRVVTAATPVFHDQEIMGILVGVYDVEALTELFLPAFDGKGFTYITTSDGEIIFKAKTENSLALDSNLFDALEKVKVDRFDTLDQIKATTAEKKSGHCDYIQNGEKHAMHYAPIGINDWYIFSMAPDDSITPQVFDIMFNTSLFMLAIGALFVFVLCYYFLAQMKNTADIGKITFVDSLTGAANKNKFESSAQKYLSSGKNIHYSFVILDIDKFKVLNDTLGYDCGDMLLIQISETLASHMDVGECYGRCNSDEFYMLLKHGDDTELRTRIQDIIYQIESTFKLRVDGNYGIVLCVGVYNISNPRENINVISDKARHAHKLTKGGEESAIAFYNEELRNNLLEEKEIENRMHKALADKEFIEYLQPKYTLPEGEICGAEALVRWQNPDGTMTYPDVFIPIFERNGFITKLDRYMLRVACETIRAWIDEGITPIPVSINFSRLHLENPNFVDDIAAIAEQYNIPHKLIEIELTESTMLYKENVLVEMLGHLHEHGFTLSMDDFGSGYSSLGLLKNLPVDTIKLDKTFFAEYCDKARAKTVTASMISMAKQLGTETVAEGVETLEQVQLLTELGCDIVQGYYFAKPMPTEELKKILIAREEKNV
ncbi:MAG: EAL domain-containing protein [Oscillospiraceae bacterium]